MRLVLLLLSYLIPLTTLAQSDTRVENYHKQRVIESMLIKSVKVTVQDTSYGGHGELGVFTYDAVCFLARGNIVMKIGRYTNVGVDSVIWYLDKGSVLFALEFRGAGNVWESNDPDGRGLSSASLFTLRRQTRKILEALRKQL